MTPPRLKSLPMHRKLAPSYEHPTQSARVLVQGFLADYLGGTGPLFAEALREVERRGGASYFVRMSGEPNTAMLERLARDLAGRKRFQMKKLVTDIEYVVQAVDKHGDIITQDYFDSESSARSHFSSYQFDADEVEVQLEKWISKIDPREGDLKDRKEQLLASRKKSMEIKSSYEEDLRQGQRVSGRYSKMPNCERCGKRGAVSPCFGDDRYQFYPESESKWNGKYLCSKCCREISTPKKALLRSIHHKDSYFASCERDESGHCLPKGESGGGPAAEHHARKKPEHEALHGGLGPHAGAADLGLEYVGKLPDGSPRRHAPPPPGERIVPAHGPLYRPDPEAVDPSTGLPCCARVGVPAMMAPPPPKKIPRLPNLTGPERDAENRFVDYYEQHWQEMVDAYDAKRNRVVGADKNGNPIYELGDAPHIFSTDDAKMLSPDYNKRDGSKEEQLAARGLYNQATFGAANAIAKKAFQRYLDKVAQMEPSKRTVLMTAGGCASGKTFALGSIPETQGLMDSAGAVWDAAGELCSVECPWVLQEARKRGLRVVFAFISADPVNTWENPGSGVVERAAKKGRMVNARSYADSYALGARNFKRFMDLHIDDPDCDFHVFDNPGAGRGAPKKIPVVPERDLSQDPEQVYKRASDKLKETDGGIPYWVREGGLSSDRIWGMAAGS